MDYDNNYTQYGGFVRNLDTGEYDLMFVTELSALLAKNRSIERADTKNQLGMHYDTDDCCVKQRTVRKQFGTWFELA